MYFWFPLQCCFPTLLAVYVAHIWSHCDVYIHYIYNLVIVLYVHYCTFNVLHTYNTGIYNLHVIVRANVGHIIVYRMCNLGF